MTESSRQLSQNTTGKLEIDQDDASFSADCSSQIPQYLKSFYEGFCLALQTGDELQIVKAYPGTALDPFLSRDQKHKLENARFRLIIWNILKDAIQADDDFTICRWFNPELFAGSKLISNEHEERIELALTRLKELTVLRQQVLDESIDIAEVAERWISLQTTSLLTELEREQLQSKDKDEVVPSSEPAGLVGWLNGEFTISDLTDNIELVELQETILQYGYEKRVQRALEAEDSWLLRMLCSPEFATVQSKLSEKVQEQVSCFLSGSTSNNPLT